MTRLRAFLRAIYFQRTEWVHGKKNKECDAGEELSQFLVLEAPFLKPGIVLTVPSDENKSLLN